MSPKRWSTTLVAALLALAVAAPAAAGGQRKPKTGSSSTRVEVHATQSGKPAPSTSRARVPVPRSPSTQGQRQPEARGERVPGGGSGHDGYRHYPVFHGRYSWWPWGWWGWGWWGVWDPWYGPGVYGGPYWYPEQVRPTQGALDLDLRPEDAEVWLNGTLIGIADHFDGWPRYLWLDQGTYDLVFYLPGFKTIARQYTIYPGVVIDVEDRMQPGEATRPEDLVSPSTERHDERMERRVERGETTETPTDTDQPAWRDRVRAEREAMEGEKEPYVDARAEPARLRLQVSPRDAAVYLDGRFLGTADELVDVRAGLIVDPGEHSLEVVRPGYASKTRTFTADAGEEVEMTIELEEQ